MEFDNGNLILRGTPTKDLLNKVVSLDLIVSDGILHLKDTLKIQIAMSLA